MRSTTHRDIVTSKLEDHDIEMCTQDMQEKHLPRELKVIYRELVSRSNMLVEVKLSLENAYTDQEGLSERY